MEQFQELLEEIDHWREGKINFMPSESDIKKKYKKMPSQLRCINSNMHYYSSNWQENSYMGDGHAV